MLAFRDLSIRRKLTVVVMVTTCTAIWLACGAFFTFDIHTLRQTRMRDLETLAEVLGSNSTAAVTFDDLAAARDVLQSLAAKPHIMAAALYGADGAVDSEGKSVFLDLMRRRKVEAILYCFDLLWHDGEDLRSLPLLERKKRLQRLIKGSAGLLYAEHIETKGVDLFRAICDRDLEGVVCKHKISPYVTSPATWFKVLNPDYSQKRGRQEMFENFKAKSDHVPA